MKKEVMFPREAREEGQSLILVAFAIIVIVGFVGLGVDLGLAYVERVRIQRAADAAALAAAAELPLETAAGLRALEYLAENDYDCGLGSPVDVNNPCTDPNVRLEVAISAGGDSGEAVYQRISGPEDPNAASFIIRLNAKESQGSRFRVEVVENVRMYFMGVLGFGSVPVAGSAMAENIQDLDIMLAFDVSGSMEFFTLCYGCWTPYSHTLYGPCDHYDPNSNLCYTFDPEENDYRPSGNIWPLPWDGPPDGPPQHCSGIGDGPYERGGNSYIIIEAEEYSYVNSDYRRDTYPGQGYTYWVISRNGEVNEPRTGHLGDTGAYGRDDRGAYISHAPRRIGGYNTDGSGVACRWADLLDGEMCSRTQWVLDVGGPYPAPRVDYEFTVPENGNWYFWILAQGGSSNRGHVYWGLDGTPIGRSDGNPHLNNDRYFNRVGCCGYNGADKNKWLWGRLGIGTDYNGFARYLEAGKTYTLNIWAGGAGFALDRIIITDDNGTTLPNQATRLNRDYIDNNRTGSACNPCDSRFAGYPGGVGYDNPPNCNDPNLPEHSRHRYRDDLYDDEQPHASAVASSIRFINMLDFNFDQIGLVTYSSRANRVVQLLCLKSNGQGCTKNVINNTIIDTLNSRNQTKPGGSTNIADALEEAIEALDNDPPHYGRSGAAKIIILMTDGQPNTASNLRPKHQECHDMNHLWPGNDSSAFDCSIYFANMARDKGIIIFGITLGDGADQELMQTIAERTGGIHRHAEEAEALDGIFDELYNRIFLRLVE